MGDDYPWSVQPRVRVDYVGRDSDRLSVGPHPDRITTVWVVFNALNGYLTGTFATYDAAEVVMRDHIKTERNYRAELRRAESLIDEIDRLDKIRDEGNSATKGRLLPSVRR
jgi:hypothetical protein